MVLFIVGVLAAIAIPNFRRARLMERSRNCYANQKNIAGALEMYNLDRNVSVTWIDSDIYARLKEGGYIQSIPVDLQDPEYAQGKDTSRNYRWTATGNGIECIVHGAIFDD